MVVNGVVVVALLADLMEGMKLSIDILSDMLRVVAVDTHDAG